MGILQSPYEFTGETNVFPSFRPMVTTDNLATITAAGYLNSFNLQGNPLGASDVLYVLYSFNQNTNSGTFGVFTVSISNGVITLSQWANPGDVLLPVQSNHIAAFNGTTGQIYSPTIASPQTIINNGNIQAGVSGTAGTLTSFPGTAANGSFIFKAINNSGNFNSTLSNSNIGQSTVYSLPDPGAATANIIISASGSAQTISGGLTISTGNLNVTAGNVVAGSSGNAGTVTSFPGTAANGSFVFAAVNNTGNFVSTLSNSNIGQATVYSLPDVGAATGKIISAGGSLVSGNINQNSGTGGAVVDSGIAALNVSIMKVFTLTFTQLASAGKVNIQVHPSGTSQYFIQDIKVLTSTGLSGGGGNRLLAVTDGTLVWNNAGITAALLGTPIFTLWGGTGNPIAVSTSQVSTAGADIYFQYTGGTTDYTAGSVQIAVTYVKVTA